MEITKGTFKNGEKGWKAVEYNRGYEVGLSTHEIHYSDDGECVAEVVHGEADAKLIAAAPNLLEALEYCLGSLGDEYKLPIECILEAQKAIEKAKL